MSSANDQPGRDAAAGAPRAAPSGSAARPVPRPAPHYEATSRTAARRAPVAMGVTVGAAMFMMLSGIWTFFEGLAALIRGSFFVVLPDYAFDLSVTAWGWFHLVLGALVFAAGIALFTDALWARVVGVSLASLSALTSFLFIPYAPAWSILVIAIDALVIWALVSPRRAWA
jgi:hypothetical protein